MAVVIYIYLQKIKFLKMKNKLVLILAGLAMLLACRQNKKSKAVNKIPEAAYTLPYPQGWGTELFSIPIQFAPQIAYKGVEDIRFAPGWAKAGSNEYWTYCFLWALENNPAVDAATIDHNLKAYYTGLINSNSSKNKIAANAVVETVTAFGKVPTAAGDVATFKGTIHMLDYMQQQPITLNCMVHLKSCSEQSGTYIFHKISPKPFTDSVWRSLDKIWADFECNSKGSK
jgi:hypothetical protein